MSGRILVTVCGAFLGACGSICSNVVTTESTSPDGRYVAAVYERDCGATVDFVTHVGLRTAGTPFDGSVNGAGIFEGLPVVSLEWQSHDRLVIRYQKCPEDSLVRADARWAGVTIEYDEGPSLPPGSPGCRE
jgi:hypothetical protein